MPRTPDSSPQTVMVLAALLQSSDGWHYGYDLSKRTGLRSGTLYPILIRLVERGWLETRWSEPQVPGRPPRHLYRLTAGGAVQAQDRVRPRQSSSPRRISGEVAPT